MYRCSSCAFVCISSLVDLCLFIILSTHARCLCWLRWICIWPVATKKQKKKSSATCSAGLKKVKQKTTRTRYVRPKKWREKNSFESDAEHLPVAQRTRYNLTNGKWFFTFFSIFFCFFFVMRKLHWHIWANSITTNTNNDFLSSAHARLEVRISMRQQQRASRETRSQTQLR